MKRRARYRLRTSVSIVPTRDAMTWQFFQANTRRTRHIRVEDVSFIDALRNPTYQRRHSGRIDRFMDFLYQACLVEDIDRADEIDRHRYNRVIHFLADYFPTDEALAAFQQIRAAHVLIVGVGAVGGWIAQLLAQSGVGAFTLCDPDSVKPANLNRSLFFRDDIGEKKTHCIARNLRAIDPDIAVDSVERMIATSVDIEAILATGDGRPDLVINAADFPNVDATSESIAEACMHYRTPHIIAGGYNLHLSLIGPTIIPYETPCFKCIERGLAEERPDDFSNVRKLERPKRNIGNMSPMAGISASFVAFEAIRVLVRSKRLTPIMAGRRGEFNFLTSELKFSEYSRRADCAWCGRLDTKPRYAI